MWERTRNGTQGKSLQHKNQEKVVTQCPEGQNCRKRKGKACLGVYFLSEERFGSESYLEKSVGDHRFLTTFEDNNE